MFAAFILNQILQKMRENVPIGVIMINVLLLNYLDDAHDGVEIEY